MSDCKILHCNIDIDYSVLYFVLPFSRMIEYTSDNNHEDELNSMQKHIILIYICFLYLYLFYSIVLVVLVVLVVLCFIINSIKCV
jgi:hypothetical protein